MGQGRSHQTHHQEEKKNLVQKVGAFWSQVLDRREQRERALNLLAKYYDIFTLEDGEMGCTEATEHRIKVTDPKPFKERPRIFLQVYLKR